MGALLLLLTFAFACSVEKLMTFFAHSNERRYLRKLNQQLAATQVQDDF